MKKKTLIISILVGMLALASMNLFAAESYGSRLCQDDGRYDCHRVRSGESWESLFPDLVQRDIVMRINRINIRLRPGMIISIPNDLVNDTIIAEAPFPVRIQNEGSKQIIVDLNKLAWAAYDQEGNLIHWGPASGGKGFCPDVDRPCYTATGSYKIFRKQPAKCVSSVFPIEYDGGAPMPYCMHFYSGFALHGSYEVPGYNASHGCVRMFINDARWLNEQFATIGTRVTILPYEP